MCGIVYDFPCALSLGSKMSTPQVIKVHVTYPPVSLNSYHKLLLGGAWELISPEAVACRLSLW